MATSFSEKSNSNLRELLSENPQLQIPRDEYNITVTSNEGDMLTTQEVEKEIRQHPGKGFPTHLYFHVPVCNYVCHFCNYVKYLLPRGKEAESLQQWGDVLVEESSGHLKRFPWIPQAKIESFYIGGGTAALLLNAPSSLKNLLQHCRENYSFEPDAEWSLEGNPDNFSEENVETAVAMGFNRFSVGVQSLDDRVNSFTGRLHTKVQSLESIDNLLKTRVPFNVDMMFGLPYQTLDSVRDDILQLVRKNVPTITIYRLRNADRQSMGIGNRSAWNTPKIRERLVQQKLFPSF